MTQSGTSLSVMVLASLFVATFSISAAQSVENPAGIPEDQSVDTPTGQPDTQVVVTPVGYRNYNATDPEAGWLEYLLPIPLIVGENILWWLPSKAAGAEYAQISWSSMKTNLTSPWVFDEDQFVVNQWGHPYQGSWYYSTARSLGLNFWASIPYTAFGSAMWETLMETESASINDLITTTMGGTILGETLFRLSNQVLDDTTSGAERFWREFGALAINPVYGFSRIFTGQAWAYGPPHKKTQMDAEARFGMGAALTSDEDEDGLAFTGALHFDYGTITTLKEEFKPFDYFTFDLAGAVSTNGGLGGRFAMTGLALGHKYSWAASEKNAVVGGVFDYEFFTTERFKIGTSGIGAAVISEFPLVKNMRFDTHFIVDGVFGAITTDHVDNPHRANDYNFGVGAAGKIKLNLRFRDRGRAYLNISRYWLHTVSGTDGEELAGAYTIGCTVPVYKILGVGGQFMIADKEGLYQDFENTSYWSWSGQGYLALLY